MTAVSVIIPTFNRARMVSRAVTSVLYQTFTDYEIILVDDGSRDKTVDCVAQFRPRLKYISHRENLGISAARNTGIRASRSPLIAFLDSDDYWLPEKLSSQLDFFGQNPESVACQTEEIWIRKGRRVNPRTRHLKPSGDIFEPSLRLCLVSPSAVMLKRTVFDDVGLFDEDLPACEDYDLWLRISCRYPIHLINRHLIVKTGGESDQLSAKYSGMDRFRIKALIKLIDSGQLNENQIQATLRELTRKCKIYGTGCLKHGKNKEAQYFLQLPERLNKNGVKP